MCNELHENFKPIDKTGFGYKIFTYNPYARKYFYRPMFGDGSKKPGYIKGLNKWNPKIGNGGDGFCFFLSKKDAIRYRDYFEFSGRQIRKIKYRKGLGKVRHNRRDYGGMFTFSLCKEFKILENEK
jgi:hypothetical protein